MYTKYQNPRALYHTIVVYTPGDLRGILAKETIFGKDDSARPSGPQLSYLRFPKAVHFALRRGSGTHKPVHVPASKSSFWTSGLSHPAPAKRNPRLQDCRKQAVCELLLLIEISFPICWHGDREGNCDYAQMHVVTNLRPTRAGSSMQTLGLPRSRFPSAGVVIVHPFLSTLTVCQSSQLHLARLVGFMFV